MKTEEEFVNRWKYHLTGMALFGTVSENKDGPLVRAAKAHEIPKEVETLLRRLYRDLIPPEPLKEPSKPLANGAVAQPVRKP